MKFPSKSTTHNIFINMRHFAINKQFPIYFIVFRIRCPLWRHKCRRGDCDWKILKPAYLAAVLLFRRNNFSEKTRNIFFVVSLFSPPDENLIFLIFFYFKISLKIYFIFYLGKRKFRFLLSFTWITLLHLTAFIFHNLLHYT